MFSAGFHATPDIGYDFATNSGNAFNYFTYGVGCSVVEIDCLTGDHQVAHSLYLSISDSTEVCSVLCCKTIHRCHNQLYNHGEGPY